MYSETTTRLGETARHALPILTLALLCAPLAAQEKDDPTTPEPARVSKAHGSPSFDPSHIRGGPDAAHVYFDTAGDGAVWAASHAYKARFDASGATYIPFLGARASENHPVTYTLAKVSVGERALELVHDASAVRTGDTVSFDRGSLVELYELSPTSVEQKFVFQSLPDVGHASNDAGDLVLRIDVATDFEGRDTEQGVELTNELGTVRYSSAIAVDARGIERSARTRWTDHGIEIRVPADFLASARFPLTIDPWTIAFPVDTTTEDTLVPDTAYDVTNDVYLVTWERAFSATDHDIYAELHDSNGFVVAGSGAYVDLTSAYWGHPKVANNNIADQFLVVAQVKDPSGVQVIKGRTRSAASSAMSAPIDISGTQSGVNQINPDVGGDASSSAPTYYCVVWEWSSTTIADSDIHARLVLADGTLLGSSAIGLSTSGFTKDQKPRISKCDGAFPSSLQEWNVVWQRELGATSHDIYMAQVHWNGTITTPTTAVDLTNFDDDTDPVAGSLLDGVSGPRSWLVAYEHKFTTNPVHEPYVRLMNGSTILDSGYLGMLEHQTGPFLDRIDVSVDSDGSSFVLAYSEEQFASQPNYTIYVTTLTPVAGRLHSSESHVHLYVFSGRDDHPAVTCQHSGGGPARYTMVVWSYEFSSTDHDIYAVFYSAGQFTDFCLPGIDALACPCGNAPGTTGKGCNNSSFTGGALLAATGLASLSNDSVLLTSSGEKPTATSVFLQGSAIANAVFGQGVRCAGGTLVRLYTKSASGGVAAAPVGADVVISARSANLGLPIPAGAARLYQTYYRDPTVLGSCPSTSTFNVTQAVQAIWAP